MFRILNLETGRYLEWPEYTTTNEIVDKKYFNKEPEKVPTEFCTELVAECYLERYLCENTYTKKFTIDGDDHIYYKQVKPSWDSFKIIDTDNEKER